MTHNKKKGEKLNKVEDNTNRDSDNSHVSVSDKDFSIFNSRFGQHDINSKGNFNELSGEGVVGNAVASEIIYDELGNLDRSLVSYVEKLIDTRDRQKLREVLSNLHSSELADLISALTLPNRILLPTLMGEEFDYEALTEVDEAVRLSIINVLPHSSIAKALAELDTDDALEILEDLDNSERQSIISQMPVFEQRSLKEGLEYPERSAGRLLQAHSITVPPYWTVDQTINFLRKAKNLPEDFVEVFVVDTNYHVIGVLPLNKLLTSDLGVKVTDVMGDRFFSVSVLDDQEDVALLFERYDLYSVSVVDSDERFVGVITIDDVVDVIREETGKDMGGLAGVGDEEVSDSVFNAVRNRFWWLLINLVTAIFASGVIHFFDATIEKIVALAVLMPIVASMGGNAATQTMTVAVRAFATHDISRFNLWRVIGKETAIGMVNGVIFALISFVVTWLWFKDYHLSLIIAIAMLGNMVIAGSSGIVFPLVIRKLGYDAAFASTVFVTTATDVIGFLLFLGLATYYFVG